MKKEYDVIVVGSGPSGSAAAKVLVNKGLDVLIIDKKKLPRYKICSGIIFKKSLEITEKYFGKIPESAFVKPKYLKGVRMWESGTKHSDWPFDMECGGAPNVWRSEYDYWLAKNSGAEIADETKVVNFKKDGCYVELTCNRDQTLSEVRCKFLISAEGSLSTIRAKFDPEFEDSIEWYVAYQNYCKGSSKLDPEYYHGFFDANFGDVYAWFNCKADYVVFGTAIKKGNKLEPYLTKYTRFLADEFELKIDKVEKKASCMGSNICSTSRFYLGSGNILFVGEAAGFLNMFGEGISSALSTGILAANAICESIDTNKEPVPIYEKMAKREKRYTTNSWKLAERMAGRKVM